MIDYRKLRAARAYLGLKQPELSKLSGVSLDTIVLIEKGRKSNIHQKTEDNLIKALNLQGVFIFDNRIELPSDYAVTLTDYVEVLDIALQMLSPGDEICFHRADDRKSTPEVQAKLQEMVDYGIKMRSTIEEGNTVMQFDPDWYRWIPSDYYVEGEVQVTFADRWLYNEVITHPDGTEEYKYHMHKSESLFKMHRADFEAMWKFGACPDV